MSNLLTFPVNLFVYAIHMTRITSSLGKQTKKTFRNENPLSQNNNGKKRWKQNIKPYLFTCSSTNSQWFVHGFVLCRLTKCRWYRASNYVSENGENSNNKRSNPFGAPLGNRPRNWRMAYLPITHRLRIIAHKNLNFIWVGFQIQIQMSVWLKA